VLDWFDKLNDDNHNLIKVTLFDGSEWAVDFLPTQQRQTSSHSAPLERSPTGLEGLHGR
jgi:hypothetical protein